jgi:transcriptional regulator with XRE-family HTH domain
MADPAPGSFGAHVRGLRVARGLKQEELAERCELHVDTIKGMERNTFEPSLRTLRKLAKGLGGCRYRSCSKGTNKTDTETLDSRRSPTCWWLTTSRSFG